MIAEEAALEEALRALARAGVDLRDYRREPLLRRLRRRAEEVGARDLGEYVGRLDRDAAEVRRLGDALLVHVTAFFRDPAAFDALAAHVLPALRRGPGPLRAWAVGVATGEEAWSLAAVLRAACGDAWEALATDRDAASLEVASRATYPREALAGVPPAFAGAFEEAPGGAARVVAGLRARVRFAVHDLMGPRVAPPEAVLPSFPLVLCRNVLVYFDARFQAAATERLHAVVAPGGALLLGRQEALPLQGARLFERWPDLDPSLRLYRRRVA